MLRNTSASNGPNSFTIQRSGKSKSESYACTIQWFPRWTPKSVSTASLLHHGTLPELSYRAAVKAFGVHGAAELIYLVGLYCLVSVTLNGFNVPVPESEAE